MSDQLNIKIDAVVDDELTRLLSRLSELKGDVSWETVERFLGGLDTLAELVTIHVEDCATNAFDRCVVFKPSDLLLEFAATLAI